jgi:hypothetical protein
VADGTGISLVGGNITIQSGTPEGEPRNPLDSPHRMARFNWPVPHHLESSTPQHSSRCRT